MKSNLYCELLVTDQATQAAEWCNNNRIDYDLQYWGWPGATKYRFIFNDESALAHFILKWT